ncbi:MAG: VanZ family protein [Candidatus Omnitrophota bacterium]
MKKFLNLWLLPCAWAGFIFYLSGIQSLTTNLGVWDFILRKIAHVSEYFILTMLIYRAFRNSFRLKTIWLLAWPACISLGYAISDEFHQSFITTRSGNSADVVIDAAGIALFCALLPVFRNAAFLVYGKD